MDAILLKKNTFKIVFIIILFVIFIVKVTISYGIQNYYNTDFITGLVTATSLNVREGPGINYKIVCSVKKNEYIRVFAGIGDWYIVQVEGNYVGAVNKKYVKPIYPNTTSSNNASNSTNNSEDYSSMSSDEKEVLNLINSQRQNNGLSALKTDKEINRIARIKAQDMVDNNYFAHESPTYGTPFNMLKSFSISYKSAGENIAGNSSNSGAVNAWMNSPGHKANILNSNFNYTGIGVVNSSKYGKIYVQIFIEK